MLLEQLAITGFLYLVSELVLTLTHDDAFVHGCYNISISFYGLRGVECCCNVAVNSNFITPMKI